MAIQRARSIDTLYTAISDSDIALSTEGPLTLALDNRITTPQLGRCAATPRAYAANRLVPVDERPLFHELLKQTDLPWKTASHCLSEILECWERTGDPTNVLQAQFDTPSMRKALAVITDASSSFQALTQQEPITDRSVAVIGEPFLKGLDRTLLPESYQTVSPFSDGHYELPPVRIFDSPTDIVATLLNALSANTADDVAIVVDQGSEYATAIEAAFEANEIPFNRGPGFEDEPSVRHFIQFLRAGFDTEDRPLETITPLARHLGLITDVADHNRRLGTVTDTALTQLTETLAGLSERTFQEALKEYRTFDTDPLWELESELERLGLGSQLVTSKRISELEFYLENFTVPTDSDNGGVLLADATSSVYVDRPTVFYVGLDRNWERSIPDRPWVDADREDELNLKRFQLLLQNGREQQFLVVNSRGGEPVTPCLYFEELLEFEFETFADFPSTRHGSADRGDTASFDRTPLADAPSEPVESLSQSALSRVVNSPRDWYMDQLVDDATDKYRQRGSLLHDVAEVCVAAPALIDEHRDTVLDWLIDNQRPFIDAHKEPIWRTRFEVAVDLLQSYAADATILEEPIDGYEPLEEPNALAAHLDAELDSTITEQWFKNDDLGAHGVVDLLQNQLTVVDYKTGARSGAKSVLRDADLNGSTSTPNYQPLHYLAHHRDAVPNKQLTFRLVYFLEDLDQAITDPDAVSVHDSVTDIHYSPQTFDATIASEAVYEWLWTDLAESNNRRKTLEKLGYGPYEDFFAMHGYPDADSKDGALASPIAEAFEAHCVDHVGEYKYVRKGAASTIKKLYGYQEGRLFAPDIDEYETFLTEWIERVNEYRATRFPVGDPNPDRLDHPLLIVEGEQ